MRVRKIMTWLGLQLWLCGWVFASEGVGEIEAEQPPSVFEGTFGESIWTLVWFFVLLAVLWKFAWKPMLAGLTGRTEYIEKQISDAEKTRADAKKVLEEYGAKLADAERQGRDIISTRTKQAEQQAREVQLKAQKDLEEKQIRAEADIERQRTEAEDELWDQAGDIVRRLGQEVFGKTLDKDDNKKLIDEAIARLKQQGQ